MESSDARDLLARTDYVLNLEKTHDQEEITDKRREVKNLAHNSQRNAGFSQGSKRKALTAGCAENDERRQRKRAARKTGPPFWIEVVGLPALASELGKT
jgi:hypothetical protein